MTPTVPDEIGLLFEKGRDDIGYWAGNGFGVLLHDKQLVELEELEKGDSTFHVWWWANRVGKTTGVVFWHLHGIMFKPEIPRPETRSEHEKWVLEDYRTLHSAPLGLLATRAYDAIGELIKGTHPAQRDENGKRRPAPLGAWFVQAKERDAHGAEHMVVRSLSGGVVDFFSTEGGAARLESMAWRRISWDEWPQQEGADKGQAIRTVLLRLQNRASDFDAKVLLTGTITPETEHIAKEFIERCEDPNDPDWHGSAATRLDNPSASRKAIELAKRSVESGAMDAEDFARTIMGAIGGVKGRLFPSFMLDPIFKNDLPRFTPPVPGDGAVFEVGKVTPGAFRGSPETPGIETNMAPGRWRSRSDSPYTYLHIWDLAIAVADNVGHVWRLPADWRFDTTRPIEGVQEKIIPGSRTLTSAEIVHTIEETFLPYGGLIVVDTTDAHGKNIYRELRRAGYPVEPFTFNERDTTRGVIRKDQAIIHTRAVLTDGMEVRRDGAGEELHDPDGIPLFDRAKPYGALRLPKHWTKPKDQLSILRIDDDKQRKDAAMVVLMGCDVAYRNRRARTRRNVTQRFAVFAGGRRYGRR